MSEKIFPDTLLTTAGRQMIVDSQGGSTITFTRVALGDGVLAQGQDQSALTAIISEKLSANISSYTDNEDGTFSLVFSVNNSTLDVGFMHREIGIMAKVDDGEEQLYAYTNAGTAATFLYDKTTPIQERVVRIDFVVGSAENLSVEIDGSVVYPTRGEVQQMISTHDTGSDSHADLLHLRKPSTEYAAGDIAYSALLPSWAYIECTVGGTTDSGDLPMPSSVVANATFTDGTVTWKVLKVGFDNEQELATKANRHLSNLDTNNLSVHVVVDSYYNSTTGDWYRVYDDGWVEQGGRGDINKTTVTLLKPMADNLYYVNACNGAGKSGAGLSTAIAEEYLGVYNCTTTSFNKYVYSSSSALAYYFAWYVAGMGASV